LGDSVGDDKGCGEGVDFGMIEAEKFLGRGQGDKTSIVKEGDAMAEKKGFADVVGDEDYGFVETASEGPEFALKFGAGDGIEGAEGFVHEENRRIGSKSTGDADTLALTAGEFARATGGKFGWIEADHAEQFIDAGSDSR
jgi:hypothetical protein